MRKYGGVLSLHEEAKPVLQPAPAASAEGGGFHPAMHLALIDDDQAIHETIRDVLAVRRSGWRLDSYYDGDSALERLPVAPPRVVLMDLRLPGVPGIECTRGLKALTPRLPIVIFTGQADPGKVLESVMAGACGFLLKPVNLDRLVMDLDRAVAGQPAFCDEAVVMLVTALQEIGVSVDSAPLSRQERRVTSLLLEGLPDKEIAQRLQVAPETVHAHLKRIFKKLGVHSRDGVAQSFFPRKQPC